MTLLLSLRFFELLLQTQRAACGCKREARRGQRQTSKNRMETRPRLMRRRGVWLTLAALFHPFRARTCLLVEAWLLHRCRTMFFDSTTGVHEEAIARPHVEILSESQIKGPTSMSNEVASMKSACIYTWALAILVTHSHHHLQKTWPERRPWKFLMICHVVLLWQNNAKWSPNGNTNTH